MSENIIEWNLGSDGIVVLTIDDPSQTTNTWNTPFRQSLAETVDRLEAERDNYVGVIITSGKEIFSAGADLKEIGPLMRKADAVEITTFFDGAKALLRRLERLGKPVVAAINGTALGGGLELALATHHRITVDRTGIQIGLPEVTLGVIPGAGGVVRTVRMFGLAGALTNVLLKGTKFSPRKARCQPDWSTRWSTPTPNCCPPHGRGLRRTLLRCSPGTAKATRCRVDWPPGPNCHSRCWRLRPTYASSSREPICRPRAI
jgi:3-hydroxyacyl-CoA dehydrogenase / enoyl-CoA hydratase / 3-hydroxybutyryl-CoA epimerase